MKYDFKCGDCDRVETLELALDEFDAKKQEGVSCTSCDGKAQFKLDVAGMQFCFRGDAWADKNHEEKKYRKNRSKYMAYRQSKNNKKPTLTPNYLGKETASWKEAQEAARDDGKVYETYQPLVHKENRG